MSTGYGRERADAAPVTVRQLLATEGMRSHAELVAGSAGLDHVVTDVITGSLQGSSSVPALTVGSLAVLDGSSLKADTYQVDMAIRAAHDARGSGLVLYTARSNIPLAAIRLAEKLKLPTIVSTGADPIVLADALRQIVRAPQVVRSAILLEAIDVLRKSSGSELDVVLARLGEILNARLGLVGSDGTLVAGASDASPPEVGTLIEVPTVARSNADVFATQPLSLAARERPTFWLIARMTDPTDSWTTVVKDALDIAAMLVTTRLVSERLERERDARFRLGVFNSIVSGQERPEPVLLGQLAVLGWQVDGWCTAIHAQASGDVDSLRILTLTEEFIRALNAGGITGPVVERPDGWTVWTVARNEPEASSYTDIARRLRDIAARFAPLAPRMSLHIGIGRPYAGLSGLRTSLAEAKEAATISQAAGHVTDIQHIDEMGVRRILLGWYTSESFAEFAQTLLGPLLNVDHDGALLATLESYLDSESSATLAAAKLDVHRNTVLNRVERLRSLLTVDLDDPDERLAVQLACRVVKLRRQGTAREDA